MKKSKVKRPVHAPDEDDEEPPDTWDNEGPDRASIVDLDRRALALRTAWIDAVRDYHARRHGTKCSYNSSAFWDGGRDKRTGRVYKPKWPQFVARADAAGVDPLALVTVLFESWTTDTLPLASALVWDANIERLRRRGPVVDARVAVAVRKEETVFSTALWAAEAIVADPRAAVRYVLNDQGRQLSPLFRYSMAVIAGHHDIAERWREVALTQFRAAPDSYLTHWRHVLPAELTGQSTTEIT